MKHNNFKFTIKFILTEGTDRKLLEDYIQACCYAMPQPCCTPKDILITYYRDNRYTAYIEMIVKDYGVPQVGIDIVAGWIAQMYEHCINFSIDTMFIHPKANPPANGAIIRWDYINNCPIVQMIQE